MPKLSGHRHPDINMAWSSEASHQALEAESGWSSVSCSPISSLALQPEPQPYRTHFARTTMSTSLKQQYDEQGYVLVPSLIPPAQFTALETASGRVIARTRTGQWPHRRTVGRQFPPYGDGDPDSWGVQHVMHPDLGEPAFARWYTSDALVGVVRELLGCGEDDLQMGECFCV